MSRRYYGADVPRSTGPHPDPLAGEIDRIRQRLADWYTPDEVEMWLTSPQPLLDGAVAADLIAAGEVAKVDHLIDQLESGVYL